MLKTALLRERVTKMGLEPTKENMLAEMHAMTAERQRKEALFKNAMGTHLKMETPKPRLTDENDFRDKDGDISM